MSLISNIKFPKVVTLVDPGWKMLKFYIKFDDYNVNLFLHVYKQIKEAEAKAALEEEKRRQQVTKQNT